MPLTSKKPRNPNSLLEPQNFVWTLFAILALLHVFVFKQIAGSMGYYLLLLIVYSRLVTKGWPRSYPGLVALFFAAGIDSAGRAYQLFDRFIWYDEFVHFVSVSSLTLLLIPWAIHIAPKKSIWAGGFLAVLIASFIGTIYEITDLAYEFYFGLRRIWGEYDTAKDLLVNTVGSFTVYLIYGLYYLYSSKK